MAAMHAIPIAFRPKGNPALEALSSAFFYVSFVSVILFMHLSQVVMIPFSFVPGGLAAGTFAYFRMSKQAFASILCIISRKTKLVITLDDETEILLKRNDGGGFDSLELPDERFICVSNHQSYLDWVYTWVLFYYMNHHGSLVIILKSTLKWIPLVGPAMQIFQFIFLKAKGWETDSAPTGIQLTGLATRAAKTPDKEGKKLSLLVYPEGTLVSKLTRPGSKRFADRKGIPDLQNLLLPRSTGTLFCLRTLVSKIPDCGFYDITIGYPGVPPHGYAQSYYTIASVFARSQPPPTVHIHIRRIPLDKIPYAAHSISPTLSAKELDEKLTASEREAFDEWMRSLWKEKDGLLEEFATNGEFKTNSAGKNSKKLEIPIGTRGVDDYLLIGANFIPVYVAYKLVFYSWQYFST